MIVGWRSRGWSSNGQTGRLDPVVVDLKQHLVDGAWPDVLEEHGGDAHTTDLLVRQRPVHKDLPISKHLVRETAELVGEVGDQRRPL